MEEGNVSLELFSTCPSSNTVDQDIYLKRVKDVAWWSEAAGCRGILVYTDNSLVDPWLVAQVIIENTNVLCPLVAVQPVYLHPYSVAKIVASLGHLYRRRVYLNMVAGGFKNDLTALDGQTSHDNRYARLIEYTRLIKQLLLCHSPLSFAGEFYQVHNLKMVPPLPQDLFPGLTVSGSSEAGLAAARALGAVAIQYPKPVSEYAAEARDPDIRYGVRVGIIARDKDEAAWEIARGRFPEDRKSQLTHQLAMKTSDSLWHKQLSDLAKETAVRNTPYWLVPFENYKTFCPYLVGSYERVAQEIAGYIALGNTTFILDIPPSEEELAHTNMVFRQALERVPEMRIKPCAGSTTLVESPCSSGTAGQRAK